MEPSEWERIQELFHRASELPPEGWRTFLEAALPGEPGQVERVLELLEADRLEAPILEGGVAELAHQVLRQPAPVPPRVGPYHIRGVLGEGGMGVVYLAERPDLGSRVALKMLRDAWLSPARRERFAGEQRTLAALNHPGIARLYDADTLPDGTPWIVMEYVEGTTLTDHCRERGSSLEERLALFRSVCEAVGHAHANLVVHRDLKPSNILVTPTGTVKLLDFGIARQLETLDTPRDSTRTALQLMTPSYAAPEQLQGGAVGVFTDIYALGVVLYELLTGRLPHDVGAMSPAQAERTVLERDPIPPSSVPSRISAPGSAWEDLDVLVLKAMHREPERRYATVDALLQDLLRFSGGRPLLARPDSLRYRMGKALRRHPQGVAAALVMALTVSGLVGYYTNRLAAERSAARLEAERATQVSDYLVSLFEAGDPFSTSPEEQDIGTLLERGIDRAEALSDQPGVQAQLFDVLGGVHTRTSRYAEAETLLLRALELRRQFPDGELELAGTLTSLGTLYRYMGSLETAERHLREALAIRVRLLPDAHEDRAEVLDALGVVLANQGRYEEGFLHLEEALATYQGALLAPDIRVAATLNNMAVNQASQGNYEAAEIFMRQSLGVSEGILEPDDPNLSTDLGNLGVILEIRGDMAGAEAALTRSLEILRSRLGDAHYQTAFVLTQLGGVLRRAGELPRAEERLREAMAIEEQILEPGHRNRGVTRVHLAGVLQDAGRLDEAEPFYREGEGILAGSLGEEHEFTSTTRCHLAQLLQLQDRLDESEATFRSCLPALERSSSGAADVLATFKARYANLLDRQGHHDEAETLLLESHATLRSRLGPDHRDARGVEDRIRRFYLERGRPGEAAGFRSLDGS
jgi:eukaryotic-like serine/threonine-protein kinase